PRVSSAGSSRYLVDINDATKNSFRLYAYASDIDGDELNVTATDGNTTYVLGRVYAGKYQSTVITPKKAGNYTYSVTANDGKKSSNTAEVKVEVIAANQAPIFTTALTSAQVNINTSKTFTCAAKDPEGYEVSYKWYLGDTQQSSTTGSFSYTFSQTGSFVVSCVASDPEGKSTTSSATITVINPSASGTLTINTDYPGLIVATHNTTTLALIEQKASDANGVASFTVSGSDRATFSISRGPDFVIPQDKVVAAAMQEVAYYVGSACSNPSLPNKPTECATFDYCAATQATSVANWIVDFANAQGIIPVDSSVMDKNADGSVSSSEVYAVMLANLDKNGDGKITMSEENNTSTAIESRF
ncbi:MAG: PKD domain-containing protein, partial [Epsilonproteobacteria bacterium]|nr:PKD domain-containing protein [Campylobacterota bacterium]